MVDHTTAGFQNLSWSGSEIWLLALLQLALLQLALLQLALLQLALLQLALFQLALLQLAPGQRQRHAAHADPTPYSTMVPPCPQDPKYHGLKQPRLTGQAYYELLDEVRNEWPTKWHCCELPGI